jgi:ABC-type cobalamin/Fe3+-siderophores transport system ATPase subunit
LGEIILKVDGLGFSYDGNRVLDGLDLEIKSGNFVSILGPNGSGKSTLINLLSKVLRTNEGSIELFGNDLKKLSSRQAAGFIAVVPQYSNPGFDFTVREMVLMGSTRFCK